MGRGDEVVVIDNFATGRRSNIAHLAGHENFALIEHDITAALPEFDKRFDSATRQGLRTYGDGDQNVLALAIKPAEEAVQWVGRAAAL